MNEKWMHKNEWKMMWKWSDDVATGTGEAFLFNSQMNTEYVLMTIFLNRERI